MNLSIHHRLIKILPLLSLLILFTTIYKHWKWLVFTVNDLVIDGDNYVGLFKRFLELGYYNANVEGTSVVFNLFLYPIYLITDNIESSIFIMNIFSVLVTLCITAYLIYKIMGNREYCYVLIILLVSLFIGKKLPILSNDDLCSGMFYSLIVYFLYQFHYNRKIIYFVIIGGLLGICFSIRELTILWLPIIGILLLYYNGFNLKLLSKYAMLLGMSMFFVMLIFHFPSLYEKGSLSYYDKQPANKNINWVQRNHLGLKKIEAGEIPRRPWAIWKGTSFPEVEQYLKDNGNDSLPRTLSSAIKKDPVLFLKITGYNLYVTFKHYFSSFGFLVFLPMLMLLYQRKHISSIYYIVFILFSIMICSVAYSFVEFRWFHGMEMFLFLSIGFSTIYIYKKGENNILNWVYSFSILFILANKILMII